MISNALTSESLHLQSIVCTNGTNKIYGYGTQNHTDIMPQALYWKVEKGDVEEEAHGITQFLK